jgi:hypothetical protein
MTQKEFDACSEKAAELQESGYNCCQSVVEALSGEIEMEEKEKEKEKERGKRKEERGKRKEEKEEIKAEAKADKETLHKLASGFAVGMGNTEGTCGSLIGAIMIAGLKSGGKGAFRISRRINENFRARSGAITCKELKSKVDGKELCPCGDCVRNAVKAYFEVMSEFQK